MQSTTIDTVIRAVRSASDGAFKRKFMGTTWKLKGGHRPRAPRPAQAGRNKAQHWAQGQQLRCTYQLIIGLFFSKLTFLKNYFAKNATN